jgi:hypothetical protein
MKKRAASVSSRPEFREDAPERAYDYTVAGATLRPDFRRLKFSLGTPYRTLAWTGAVAGCELPFSCERDHPMLSEPNLSYVPK